MESASRQRLIERLALADTLAAWRQDWRWDDKPGGGITVCLTFEARDMIVEALRNV